MPDDKDDPGFDLGDLVDKATDLVADHTSEVKDGIGTAADLVGDHLGIDKKTVQSFEQTAKGFVDDLGEDAKPAKKTPKKKSASKTKRSLPSG